MNTELSYQVDMHRVNNKQQSVVSSISRCILQDYVVLLDERGKMMSSEGMAKLVAEVCWHKSCRCCFVHGK